MELSTLNNNNSVFSQSILHILNKTNAFDNILISLYFLGYSAEAENIIMKYDLNGCFEWLENAKNRSLF